jgi:hypothetical protein
MLSILDQAFHWIFLGLPVLYYAISMVKRGLHWRWAKWLCRNERAYQFIFEYAFLLFFFGGMVGTFALYYPNLNEQLRERGVDAEEFAMRLNIHVSRPSLQHIRWCLLGLGGWFVALGLYVRVQWPREVFDDIREALRYFVHRRQTLNAASFTTFGRETVSASEVHDSQNQGKWNDMVTRLHAELVTLDKVFRHSRQGQNARVVLELPGLNLHHWRFDSRASLTAEPKQRTNLKGRLPAFLRFQTGDQEFRALVSSINAMTSIYGG